MLLIIGVMDKWNQTDSCSMFRPKSRWVKASPSPFFSLRMIAGQKPAAAE